MPTYAGTPSQNDWRDIADTEHRPPVVAHCEVHPALGDMQIFDAVVREAHALGLRVLLDMVWAHTSDRHPWFEFSRSSSHDPRSDWWGMRVPMALIGDG